MYNNNFYRHFSEHHRREKKTLRILRLDYYLTYHIKISIIEYDFLMDEIMMRRRENSLLTGTALVTTRKICI